MPWVFKPLIYGLKRLVYGGGEEENCAAWCFPQGRSGTPAWYRAQQDHAPALQELCSGNPENEDDDAGSLHCYGRVCNLKSATTSRVHEFQRHMCESPVEHMGSSPHPVHGQAAVNG